MPDTYCGHPPIMFLTEEQSQRPTAHITWALTSDPPPGIALLDFKAVVQAAFSGWSKVADVSGTEGPAASADLLIACGAIDGPGKILAWCELPGPQPQHARVDSVERWLAQLGTPIPANQISLFLVLFHESGHFWGLPHAEQGSADLMAPIYNPATPLPGTWSTQQMQARYGPPRPTPVPTPVPLPPAGKPITVEIYGADRIVIPGYRVIRETA